MVKKIAWENEIELMVSSRVKEALRSSTLWASSTSSLQAVNSMDSKFTKAEDCQFCELQSLEKKLHEHFMNATELKSGGHFGNKSEGICMLLLLQF